MTCALVTACYFIWQNVSVIHWCCCQLNLYAVTVFKEVKLKRGLQLFSPAPSLTSCRTQPTSIYLCHHNHLAPHPGMWVTATASCGPDGTAAASAPREPTAGRRSIQGALIITNRLRGREPWRIFIAVVIKAMADYHQDIKLTRHLE